MLMCTINSIISIRFKKNKMIMQYTQITYLSCQMSITTWNMTEGSYDCYRYT